MASRLRACRADTAAEIRSLVLYSGFAFDAVASEIEVILWLSLAQRAFDSWFEQGYYWADQRRWARRQVSNWARVPLSLSNEIYDWPVRRLCSWDYATDRNRYRAARDLSNAFHVWQRSRHQLRKFRQVRHELKQLILIPLIWRHGLPEGIIPCLMDAIVNTEA